MDYRTYMELQKQYSTKISNDFLMPATLFRKFEDGVITVRADENALLLFEKRYGFTKLVFRFLNEAATVGECGETLAAFVTHLRGENIETGKNWLTAQGFTHTKTLRRHMARDIRGTPSMDGITPASAGEAYSVLGSCFKPYEMDLSYKFEGALCVRMPDGTPGGVICFGTRPVFAVLPEARGRGFGKRLYLAYALKMMRDGRRPLFTASISPDNAASRALFRGLGFMELNSETDCFVKISD